MAQTYKPLAIGSAPTLGTSGDAVKSFQTQLNTQNAGQPGYTPLKVDGLYGPLTQAASTYKPAPTISQIYNIPGNNDGGVNSASANVDSYYQTLSRGGSPVDEASIRNNILSQFQGEIDATNAIFTDRLNRAKATGEGRLGSDRAIQARRGLLGSDFGGAQTEDILSGNEADLQEVENQRVIAISNIMAGARKAADEAISGKAKAIEGGLTSHLAYLKDAASRKEANATKAAQVIYDQNFSPDKLTKTQLADTAKAFGVSPEDITIAYTNVKKTSEENKAKKEAELLKTTLAGQKVIPRGSVLVDSTGKRVASGLPPAGGTGTSTGSYRSGKAVFSSNQISSFGNALEASKGTDGYVDPQAYLDAYEAWTDPEVGGLAKDFLSKYPPKKYVNPANDSLPSYLRSSTTKPKASSREL
jgi:hypothetical protein